MKLMLSTMYIVSTVNERDATSTYCGYMSLGREGNRIGDSRLPCGLDVFLFGERRLVSNDTKLDPSGLSRPKLS